MARRRPLTAVATVVVCSLLGVAFASAQDEPLFTGSVEIVGLKATKVRQVSSELGDVGLSGAHGARGVFTAPKAKAFLVLNLELKPIFAKDSSGNDYSEADKRAVTLQVDRDPPAMTIGTCNPHGEFKDGSGSFRYIPSDRPVVYGFDPTFLVPEGATKARLTLGAATREIDLPEAVEEAIDPANAIEVQVEGAKPVKEVSREVPFSTPDGSPAKYTQQVVTTARRLALLSIAVKPKVRNGQTGYVSHFSDYALLLGKDVYAPAIGVHDGEKYTYFADGLTFRHDASGEFNAGRATLVFPLPGAVTSGKLLYRGSPVADVTFEE